MTKTEGLHEGHVLLVGMYAGADDVNDLGEAFEVGWAASGAHAERPA